MPGIFVDIERVQLSLFFWGPNEIDYTIGRNFGDEWPEKQIEEGCAWTNKDLVPMRDDGTIYLDSLHKSVANALRAIGTHFHD